MVIELQGVRTKLATRINIQDRLRKICLSFPDAIETETWGKPHFRINKKIFAGCGDEDGKIILGFRLEMDHAAAIIKTPGFWKAPYVGHKGWVSMNITDIKDWKFVREMIEESYRLIAPKKSLEKLDQATTGDSKTKRQIRKKK